LGFPNWPVIYFIITAPSIAINLHKQFLKSFPFFFPFHRVRDQRSQWE
jgi:hypothetical protein